MYVSASMNANDRAQSVIYIGRKRRSLALQDCEQLGCIVTKGAMVSFILNVVTGFEFFLLVGLVL